MVELLFDLLNKLSRGVEYLDISFESMEKEDRILTEKVNSQPMIHKVKVEAKSTLKFFLMFQPSVPGFYEF